MLHLRLLRFGRFTDVVSVKLASSNPRICWAVSYVVEAFLLMLARIFVLESDKACVCFWTFSTKHRRHPIYLLSYNSPFCVQCNPRKLVYSANPFVSQTDIYLKSFHSSLKIWHVIPLLKIFMMQKKHVGKLWNVFSMGVLLYNWIWFCDYAQNTFYQNMSKGLFL